MSKGYEFGLQKYSERDKSRQVVCPSCGRPDYVLYVNNSTRVPLGSEVGRCNHQDSCSYHKPPREYFKETGGRDGSNGNVPKWSGFNIRAVGAGEHNISEPVVRSNLLPYVWVSSKLDRGLESCLAKYLLGRYARDVVEHYFGEYCIGLSTHWLGGNIFWQIDRECNLRAGKIMLYNSENGKRARGSERDYISWVHSLVRVENYELRQCFFGEHLLAKYPDKQVAVVESEKTALMMSIDDHAVDEYVWLAVCGAKNYNMAKLEVLRGRDVILFPDDDIGNRWAGLNSYLSSICRSCCLVEWYVGGGSKQDLADLICAPSRLEEYNTSIVNSTVKTGDDITILENSGEVVDSGEDFFSYLQNLEFK